VASASVMKRISWEVTNLLFGVRFPVLASPVVADWIKREAVDLFKLGSIPNDGTMGTYVSPARLPVLQIGCRGFKSHRLHS
jgi:hypothetical protein